MSLIEKHPTYTFVISNASVMVWWAFLTLGRFPVNLSLLCLLISLAVLNFTLLFTKYVVKRRRRSP